MFNDNEKVQAPKASDFIALPSFPESDSYVAIIVASNIIKDFEDTDKEGNKRVYDAVELYFGAMGSDGNPYFVKTWPMKYSIHEKAKYAQTIKAATGAFPESGSTPKEFYGKPVFLSIEVKDKVSKKGKHYTASYITGVAAVPKAMKGNVPNLATLQKALNEQIEKSREGSKASSEDIPF